MKYMLMIYNNSSYLAELTEDERSVLFGSVDTIMSQLTESGELVGGEPLADASTATTVRIRNGVLAATDGPYAEAKEQLAGYLMVECDSQERAVEIAASWPDAGYGAMEVRAVLESSGTEM